MYIFIVLVHKIEVKIVKETVCVEEYCKCRAPVHRQWSPFQPYFGECHVNQLRSNKNSD